MRFAPTDEQVEFRDAVRRLLEQECPPETVRRAWDGEVDEGPWRSLEEMGALSVLAGDHDGGLGLDECFLVPVLEETGRVALPHPVVETAMLGVPLGLRPVRVTTDLGGGPVPFALDADAFLLGDAAGLWFHPADAVDLAPVETVDRSRRSARVEPRGRGDLVVARGEGYERTFDRGVLGTASQLVGLARAMLDRAVAHVCDRHQFGRPVGSFQAVKHLLADAALAIEFAAPAVARAAWSLAVDASTASRDVSTAKVMANAAALETGRAALQCHGAMGYTVESDLHLWLKRSWALARSWGDTAFHTRRVSNALESG